MVWDTLSIMLDTITYEERKKTCPYYENYSADRSYEVSSEGCALLSCNTWVVLLPELLLHP